MINLKIKLRDGSEQEIQGEPGQTLMEAIRKAAIYELVAMCGGSCSCATCHVFVEDGPPSMQKAAEQDEDELLDSSDYRAPNSRLSCQIKLSEELDGLAVQIAPEN